MQEFNVSQNLPGASDNDNFDSISMNSYESSVCDSEYVSAAIKNHEMEKARRITNTVVSSNQQMINLNINVISSGEIQSVKIF